MGLASQTLHQPDDGFGESDILNFDDLGMTITLGGDELTLEDKFTVTQGDFVTMQIGADNDADHTGSLASDANGQGVTENRITLNLSDATSRGLGIEDTGVTPWPTLSGPSTRWIQPSRRSTT